MGILDRIFKDMFEIKAGKIRYTSGGWAFNPSESLLNKTFGRNPNFYHGKPYIHKDADGKDMTLVSQRSVMCPNPEVGQGIYPHYKTEKTTYCVPAYICRKCQYHKKAEHRGSYRFARCMFKASAR